MGMKRRWCQVMLFTLVWLFAAAAGCAQAAETLSVAVSGASSVHVSWAGGQAERTVIAYPQGSDQPAVVVSGYYLDGVQSWKYVSETTSGNSCTLTGLAPGTGYRIELQDVEGNVLGSADVQMPQLTQEAAYIRVEDTYLMAVEGRRVGQNAHDLTNVGTAIGSVNKATIDAEVASWKWNSSMYGREYFIRTIARTTTALRSGHTFNWIITMRAPNGEVYVNQYLRTYNQSFAYNTSYRHFVSLTGLLSAYYDIHHGMDTGIYRFQVYRDNGYISFEVCLSVT